MVLQGGDIQERLESTLDSENGLSQLGFPATPEISSPLIQSPGFDEAHDLLSCQLIVVRLLAVIEGNQLLGAVDHGFEINAALRQPEAKPLDLGEALNLVGGARAVTGDRGRPRVRSLLLQSGHGAAASAAAAGALISLQLRERRRHSIDAACVHLAKTCGACAACLGCAALWRAAGLRWAEHYG